MMMSPPLVATTCCLLLALSPAAVQAAGPQKVSYVPTQVEVDAAPLRVGSQFEETMAKMALKDATQKVSEGLTANSVPLVKSNGEATLRVTLRWEDYETSHYAADLEVLRDGEVLVSATSHCPGCDETMAAEAAAKKLPELLPFLAREEAAAAVPPPETPPAQPTEPEEGELAEGHDKQPAARKVGGAGVAGIVVAAAGLGVAIAGFASPMQDDGALSLQSFDDSIGEQTTDTRLRGSLIGIGSGLFVTGVVLIVVDQTALRKRRDRRMTVAPTVSPASAGVVWSGRF